MPGHEAHISRHLAQVERIRGGDKVPELLERCGFDYAGGAVTKRGGGPLGAADCDRYLASVKDVLGVAAHSFARVNFRLAGCPNMLRDDEAAAQ